MTSTVPIPFLSLKIFLNQSFIIFLLSYPANDDTAGYMIMIKMLNNIKSIGNNNLLSHSSPIFRASALRSSKASFASAFSISARLPVPRRRFWLSKVPSFR